MPVLKDLACHVQWADTGSAFPEYGTIYGDGVVETYIAIPGHPQVFTIRLTSSKYISEGLSMVVFIDGQYQCNRNRVNLEPPNKGAPEKRSKIDFLLRQKEKPLGDGTYMGREWRFDNTNLVPQAPVDTDQYHFFHLGMIEVLVLRCRPRHTSERALSTSSSGEHSEIMDSTGSEESVAEAGGSDRKSSTSKQPEMDGPSSAAAAAEPEDSVGMMGGLFDGPADEPPPHHVAVDGPSDDFYDYWQSQNRPSARYGPQEGSYRPPDYRPHPAPFDDARRPRYSYHDHDPSPPHTYVRPESPPSRPERHVHFDYGDGRGPPPHPDAYYNRHLHPPWEGRDRPEYTRTRPSYQHRGHYVENESYPHYRSQPGRAHHSYDAGRRIYTRDAGPSSPYISHRRSSPPKHASQQAYVPPAFIPPHPEAPRGSLSHPMQHGQGPPLPPKMPMQPVHVPQFQAQPIPYVMPAGMHPDPWSGWQYSGIPGPIYLPPGNGPFFPTHVPSTNNGQSSQPGKPWGPNEDKSGNNNPGSVQYDNVSDQNPRTNSNTNGAWGDSNQNNSSGGNKDTNGGWGDAGQNNHAGGNNTSGEGWGDNNNSGGDNSNTNPADTDWGKNNDSANHNADWNGNNESGEDKNNNGWATSNDNSGDHNDQSWQNESSGNQAGGGNSWGDNDQTQNTGGNQQAAGTGWGDSNPNQESGGNQQGGNAGWGTADQNQNQNHGGDLQGGNKWTSNPQNGQSNGWSNNQNNNPTPNHQQHGWDSRPNHPPNSSNQRTPSDGRDTSRALYGPYGPYYGAKSLAQKGPPPDAEEEPRYDIPQAMGVSKQVQPGHGYLYVKKRCAPDYIDTLDEPYAKFVFKYRTKEQLKNEIGVDTGGEPTGDEDVNTLASLDKDELIRLVLRAKGALGGAIPEPPQTLTSPAMYQFEQAPVVAPVMDFLEYSLPPMRNMPNNAGLGIRHSNASGNRTVTGNAAQSKDSNSGGAPNWQENNNNWSANTGNNNGGWDGQQEQKPSNLPQAAGSYSIPSSHASRDVQARGPINNELHDRMPFEAPGSGIPGPPPPSRPTIVGAGPRPLSPVVDNPSFGVWGDEAENAAGNVASKPRNGW